LKNAEIYPTERRSWKSVAMTSMASVGLSFRKLSLPLLAQLCHFF